MDFAEIHRVVLDSILLPLFVRGDDLNLLYVNPALEESLGAPVQEALGKKCYQVFGYHERTCRENCSIGAATSEADGIPPRTTRPCLCQGFQLLVSPIYEDERVCGTVTILQARPPQPDLHANEADAVAPAAAMGLDPNTLDPNTEETTGKSQHTLEDARTASRFATCHFRDGRLTSADRAIIRLLGYDGASEEALLGMDVHDFFLSGEEYARLRSELSAGAPGVTEARLKRRDGSLILAEVSLSAGKDIHTIEKMTVTVSDGTYGESTEQERSRLANAIDQAAESVIVTDTDGTIQYANSAFYRVTGYGPDEVLGRTPRLLKSGEHDERFYANLWNTIRSGEVWNGRFVNKNKLGEIFEEVAVISPVRGKSGNIVNYVALKREVTARLLLEQQLRRARTMAALGSIAGGIAHDLNNLLQIILAHSELLMTTEDGAPADRESLDEISEAARDAGGLAKRLIAFSRVAESESRGRNSNTELGSLDSAPLRFIPNAPTLNGTGFWSADGGGPGVKAREDMPKIRILAVDDRMAYLKVLEAGLQQFGQTTFAAPSGAEAIRMFREAEVDLVICDLGMPGLSGWEVGQEIKRMCEEEGIPKTPFVLLTGSTAVSETDQGIDRKMSDCGVDAILGKPVDIPELLELAAFLVKDSA